MERYKKIRFLTGMVCFILILSIPLRVKAEVRTGGIKINLGCYEEIAGRRIAFKKNPELVPNERISYIISVENLGSDAWVRLKVDYAVNKEEAETAWKIGDSWLRNIGADWKKIGEYWYYTKPLKGGETIDFCKEVHIPDINNLPDGMKFEIISKAEAIQEAYISPDFSSENPFAGVCIEGDSSNGEWGKREPGFSVICEDGADTILNADVLFGDVEALMPGDKKVQRIEVRNANPYAIRIIMREVGEAIDERLLKVLTLTMKRGNKTIYDGPLADNALKNGLVIGEFKRNADDYLEFTLSLSEHAGNETAFQTIDLTMIFAIEPVKEEHEEGDRESEKGIGKTDVPTMYPYPDPTVEYGYSGGTWKLINEENHVWEYYFSNGSKARDGWLYLYNPYSQEENKHGWFCFNENGIMQYGWIKTKNENWYFCHEISDGNLGRLKKGWHHDFDDKRVYYLDPVTGIMQTGWREIGGKYYYFTPIEKTYRQNWFWNTKVGRWIYDFLGYRTYGSMFINERTPDGYLVGADGVWIGE